MKQEEARKISEEVVARLREMFGEGVEITCREAMLTNEVLTGISIHLPGSRSVPTAYLEDMPDGASVEDICDNIAAKVQNLFQTGEGASPLPDDSLFSRQSILDRVVIQALNRRLNEKLLQANAHFRCLDLAGVFRIPVAPPRWHSFQSALVSREIMEREHLTVEELTEAARRNTVRDLGVCLCSSREMLLTRKPGVKFTFPPYESVTIGGGLYILTNRLEMNGAALMLIPEVLEQLGEKAGMDYYIIPDSIHDLFLFRADGSLDPKSMRGTLHVANRDPNIVNPKQVLSDSVYSYSRKSKELKVMP